VLRLGLGRAPRTALRKRDVAGLGPVDATVLFFFFFFLVLESLI
jgi:hypothetical protein